MDPTGTAGAFGVIFEGQRQRTPGASLLALYSVASRTEKSATSTVRAGGPRLTTEPLWRICQLAALVVTLTTEESPYAE